MRALLDRLSDGAHESPLTMLRRTLSRGLSSGLVQQLDVRALPQVAALVRAQGLGAHMVHALHALNVPERLALVDETQSLTYAQANAKINQLAHGLRAQLGVGRGVPVALMMENRAEYLMAWVALLRLGASAIHVSTGATAHELGYVLEHSQARVLLASDACQPAAHALRELRPELAFELVGVEASEVANQTHARWHVAALMADQPTTQPERAARGQRSDNVIYTSGTTGKPKGAVRDFAGFGLKELLRVLERLPFEAGERHLIVAPLHHSGAQVFALLHAALGSTLYLSTRFEPEETLRRLSEQAIQSVFLVPTMIQGLLALPDSAHLAHPTRALRALISGAAPFPQALRERAIARFGVNTLYDFYGATELGWVTLIRGDEMLARPGSVGRAIAGQQIVILGAKREEVAPGHVGVIYVRNQQIMHGYLRDPGATEQARHGELLTVEDLGSLDEDGYLYLAGRARDMIVSGGVNVYPAEIEEALAHHPDIAEIAVIGLPDERWGERAVAVVALAEGAALNPSELEAFAREKLSSYKVPRAWYERPTLPRNPTGKVLKRTLRDELIDAC